RRAPVQVAAPRDELRALALRPGQPLHELPEPELHLVERELAGGAIVEVLERLHRALGLRAGQGELAAAPADGDVEGRLDLAQMRVERAAQAREALVVDRVELELRGAGTRLTRHAAARRAAYGRGPRRCAPRRIGRGARACPG